MKRFPDSSRAFLMTDALIGLMIVSAIATLLAAAVGSEHNAQQRLTDLRDANRVADHVLLALQHHQKPPAYSKVQIQIHSLPGDAPAGFKWTAVEVAMNGRHANLAGIVPIQGDAP